MAKNNKKHMSARKKSVVYRCVGSVLLVLSLLFALFMLGAALSKTESQSAETEGIVAYNTLGLSAHVSFGIALLLVGIYELVFFFKAHTSKEKSKKDFLLLGYAIVLFIAGILSFCTSISGVFLSIAAALYFSVYIAKRIVHAVEHKKARAIVLDVLIILLLALFLLACCINDPTESSSVSLAGIVMFLIALFNVCRMAISNFNGEILRKVIRKTYAGEILFGLLLLVVAFSIVLMRVEESIKSFTDGLWYCFMLITTIGFGDLTAVSLLGRILSVILGVYGIVVVAIITSIIVNFYGEVKDNKDEEELAEQQEIAEKDKETLPPTEETAPTDPDKPLDL